MSKFYHAEFLMFGLYFVSRDFEVSTVRPLRRVYRQSRMGLIFSDSFHQTPLGKILAHFMPALWRIKGEESCNVGGRSTVCFIVFFCL